MIVIDEFVKIENNEISRDHFIVKHTVNELKVCVTMIYSGFCMLLSRVNIVFLFWP